jgi:hypothetical protein
VASNKGEKVTEESLNQLKNHVNIFFLKELFSGGLLEASELGTVLSLGM